MAVVEESLRFQRGWHRGAAVRGRVVELLAIFIGVTAMVLLAACGENEPPEESSSLVPPGSPLGEDFVVPDGAQLIGTRFPSLQEGGWSALLLVEGDPYGVMLDLIAQARTSGLAVGTSDQRGLACSVHAETLLECNVYADGENPARTYSMELRWGNDSGAGYSHVLVRRDPRTFDYEMPTADDFETNPPQRPQLELPPPPVGIANWKPPEVGEDVASPPSWFEPTVVDREAGSAVVAPPGPASCVTGGYTAVLELDQDVDAADVVERYVTQFEGFGFTGRLSTGTFEDSPYVGAFFSTAGGGDLDAVAVGEQPAFLLLSRCND